MLCSYRRRRSSWESTQMPILCPKAQITTFDCSHTAMMRVSIPDTLPQIEDVAYKTLLSHRLKQEKSASTIDTKDTEIYQKVTAYSPDGSMIAVGSSQSQVCFNARCHTLLSSEHEILNHPLCSPSCLYCPRARSSVYYRTFRSTKTRCSMRTSVPIARW